MESYFIQCKFSLESVICSIETHGKLCEPCPQLQAYTWISGRINSLLISKDFKIYIQKICCIPSLSIVSSRPSVLSDRVPYVVQEQHGGSSVCEQRPTCSGTHRRPGYFSSAVVGAVRSPFWSISNPIISTAASSLGTS